MSNIRNISDSHIIKNEHGTSVLLRRCKTCGTKFTLCPVPDDITQWENCMAPKCDSYDTERDVDFLISCGSLISDEAIAKAGGEA